MILHPFANLRAAMAKNGSEGGAAYAFGVCKEHATRIALAVGDPSKQTVARGSSPAALRIGLARLSPARQRRFALGQCLAVLLEVRMVGGQ